MGCSLEEDEKRNKRRERRKKGEKERKRKREEEQLNLIDEECLPRPTRSICYITRKKSNKNEERGSERVKEEKRKERIKREENKERRFTTKKVECCFSPV